MDKLKGVKIVYSHPASPLEGIFLDKIYIIGLNNKNLYIDDGEYKKDIKFDLLVQLFSPLDGCNWDELLKEDEKVDTTNIKDK